MSQSKFKGSSPVGIRLDPTKSPLSSSARLRRNRAACRCQRDCWGQGVDAEGMIAAMDAYGRAAGYGFASGLRATAAPAALGARSSGLGRLLIVPAIGELIADKLPSTPSRLAPQGLVARLLAGGYAGWRVSGGDSSRILAVATGALAAVTSAFLGYHTRRYIVEHLGVPDLAVALAEDALTMGIVLALARTHD